ncbi:MAG TPA: hypothetical protein VGI16_10730 [Candidatus Acidoferrum sp.]|jgi:Tol biopolymer transport system component
MARTLRVKYIASEIHAFLFIFMWVLYFLFAQPLMNGPSGFLFVILFIFDLPISVIAFGVMFTSTEKGPLAAVLWGVLGTLWWFAIGFVVDAGIRKYRAYDIVGTEPSRDDSESSHGRGLEIWIAASVALVLAAGSVAWEWHGRQGHFESGEIGNFAFTPEGKSIVVVRSQRGSSRLEKVALNSGTSAPLGNALSCMASSLTFSPDGARLAFACENEASGLSSILIMDADGSNLHPLFSANSKDYDFAPHFASGGTEIYFARLQSFIKDAARGAAPPRRWDIYSARVDGIEAHRLTDRHFEEFDVSFSGDGRKFALTSNITSGAQLHLYALDGSGNDETTIRPIVPNGARTPIIANVSLDADGRSIYFLAASDGKKGFDYDIYREDLASNDVEKFTTANGYSTDLAVSSDGKTAAFLRWTSRWGSLPNLSRLYTIDLATKRVTALNVTGRGNLISN